MTMTRLFLVTIVWLLWLKSPYDILERIHSLESGHVGTKKLWQKYVLYVFVWGVMCCNQAVSHSHVALCI